VCAVLSLEDDDLEVDAGAPCGVCGRGHGTSAHDYEGLALREGRYCGCACCGAYVHEAAATLLRRKAPDVLAACGGDVRKAMKMEANIESGRSQVEELSLDRGKVRRLPLRHRRGADTRWENLRGYGRPFHILPRDYGTDRVLSEASRLFEVRPAQRPSPAQKALGS
jgi:hypothetical protein